MWEFLKPRRKNAVYAAGGEVLPGRVVPEPALSELTDALAARYYNGRLYGLKDAMEALEGLPPKSGRKQCLAELEKLMLAAEIQAAGVFKDEED